MRLQEETRYTSLACRDSTRKITYVGTQISAYKGNLGAKVLLFLNYANNFAKLCNFITKVLQTAFANQAYA